MSNLKLHKTQAVDNIFIEEKLLPRLTFNPGLALTVFRTTWPSCISSQFGEAMVGILERCNGAKIPMVGPYEPYNLLPKCTKKAGLSIY